MKINSGVTLAGNIQNQKVKNSESLGRQSNAAGVNSNMDRAQLSAGSGRVQQLMASVVQEPEVRHERVNALRTAISSGRYHVSDEQLSDAIGSALLPGPTRVI